jgi:hypothetical protein
MDAITENDFSKFFSHAGIATIDQGTQGGKQLSFKPSAARVVVVHFVESDRPKYLLDMTSRILDLKDLATRPAPRHRRRSRTSRYQSAS